MVLAAAASAGFALLGSGGGSSGGRALTPDEVNRLAITRFRNYQAGGRAVTITVPGTAGGLVVIGSVDYRTGTGYGVVRGTGRDTSSDGLIDWTAATVLVHPMADPPAAAPASPPLSGWFGRPLQRSGSSLDSALAITLGLGSDRPDNAELLPQNGAIRLGRETVHGHRAEVLTGPDSRATAGASGTPGTPGTVRYWIGADGTMYRVRATVASQSQPVVIDFDTQKYVPVRPLPASARTR